MRTLIAILILPFTLAQVVAEETYTASSYCGWDQSHFDVAIVPPGGPYFLHNDGRSIDPDTAILAPDTSIPWDGAHALAAAAVVDEWERALHERAATVPGEAWLADVTFDWTIVGPETDPEVVQAADITFLFTPAQDAGGRTIVTCTTPTRPPLTEEDGAFQVYFPLGTHVIMNQWVVFSFTPTDTYNIGLHEFGHALGLDHINDPAGDVMGSVYPHIVGDVNNPQECLSNLDVAQVAAGFRWLDGASGMAPGATPPPMTMAASAYAKPC